VLHDKRLGFDHAVLLKLAVFKNKAVLIVIVVGNATEGHGDRAALELVIGVM
jgi:hypothetical protein